MLTRLRAYLREIRTACDAHWAEERRLGELDRKYESASVEELERLVRAGELSPEDFRALCGMPTLKEGR